MTELVEKVFHPKHLFKICNLYKIEFIELMDNLFIKKLIFKKYYKDYYNIFNIFLL